MSIEKTGNIGSSQSLNQVVVPKLDREQASALVKNDVNQDGFLTLDEMKVPNNVKDQAFKGADLDGDGVVSQRELVIKNNRSHPTGTELENARETLRRVSALMAEQSSNHPAGVADPMLQALFNLNFSESRSIELVTEIESDADLSILA